MCMNDNDSLLGVLKSIFRWKKQILWLCLIAAIGSVIISLLLPNYYKATTIFYAASEDVSKPDPVGNALKERAYFGQEDDMDKLMTIAQSSELTTHLIKKYNLFDHYDIDSTGKKAQFKIREHLNALYEIKKTKYEAIELSIEDKDPELAAKMTNEARKKINLIANKLTKETQAKQLANKQRSLLEKQNNLTTMGDSLRALSERYGIYNVLSQSEALSNQLAKNKANHVMAKAKLNALKGNSSIRRDTIAYIQATVQGLEQQLISLQTVMDKFNQGASKVSAIDNAMDIAVEQFAEDQERMKQLKAAYEADTPMVILVEKAETPIVKSRPKRSILCLVSLMITFLFSSIAAIVIDTYKNVNWKEIINAE